MIDEAGDKGASHSSHWQNLNDLTDLGFLVLSIVKEEGILEGI